MTPRSEFLLHCLDQIEQKETRLLVWGVVDTSFEQNDLEDFLDPLLDDFLDAGNDDFQDTDEVIEALFDKGLLHQFTRNGMEYYRSRMAESVRLMSRLRQLFPRHRGSFGWQQAATLVADYRFMRRRRKFPRRELPMADIVANLKSIPGLSTQTDILNILAKNFKLCGFQARGTHRILERTLRNSTSGTIICAGTGSGKTLAFYLPSLAHIASLVQSDSTVSYWVKALAIYPRNELLKDQFSEVYAEARKLDTYLSGKGKRKIIIGAYFGPTPTDSSYLNEKQSGWRRLAGGYHCEYIRCPSEDCNDGALIWRDSDREQKKEELHCTSCGHTIKDDEIILTRHRLQKTPPDILFTSTEMMNQRMSDSWSRHLFGLGPKALRPPKFVLLDEVHTYVGMHGAQVAYLIRRWRYLVKQNVTFVGLSATLKNAQHFFADLVGLYEKEVVEISPKVEELDSQGAEYLLALRGDPVSRRSLLSTTIQATILASRVIDPQLNGLSQGIYGSKVFVFTDDIDVTNRLYFNTLDAEGRDSFGNPDPRSPNGGLAALRQQSLNTLRYDYGQDWSLCEDLGHDLSTRMGVGRTTSQDPGVHGDRDIIVATGALEVGYNDPTVGTVIQHKAPRDMAQFIQRKGRAGRSLRMRPWTIAVLSDYGRDRIAYQGYDMLFDPELPPRHLPIKNRYITRIQAVYSLIDYLGRIMQNSPSKGNIWQEFSKPYDDNTRKYRIPSLTKHIEELLLSDQAANEFQQYIQQSLRLGNNVNGQETSQVLLWDHPRPLMTTVLPTLLRRLKTNWRKNSIEKEEFHTFNSPLPEFIPANLFSELNLPDVQLIMPPQKRGDDAFITAMPIFQAMRDFAPGRVSKRFTISHKYVRHWLLPVNIIPQPGNHDLDITEIGDFVDLGPFNLPNTDQSTTALQTFRITTLRPAIPPSDINDTSNARMQWNTELVTNGDQLPLEVPKNCGWDKRIEGIEFYLHNNQNPVEIRRFTEGANATISQRNGGSFQTSFRFVKDGNQVALGVSQLVDGISFTLNIPDELWKDSNYNSKKWRALRTTRFFDLAWQGEALPAIESPFAREWLAQIYMSALVCESLKQKISLEQAAKQLRDGNAELGLTDVLEIIFQSTTIEEGDTQANTGENQDLLRAELITFLGTPETIQSLERLGQACLWGNIDSSWQPWLRTHYTATVSASIFQAIENQCPDLDTEMLLVDIDHYHEGQDTDSEEIWITEKTVGGCGVVEEIVTRFGEDPRRFFGLVDAALQPTEFELIDRQLVKLLSIVTDEDEPLSQLFKKVRNASSIETELHFKDLRNRVHENGFILFHSFFSALNNRILKPGSNSKTDHFLHKAISYWNEEENRIGIEIDTRIIAFLLSDWSDIDDFITVPTNSEIVIDQRRWRYNTTYGLLWPRGADIRQKQLSIYNPFTDFPKTERLFFDEELGAKIPSLVLGSDNWQERCGDILSNQGVICLVCPNDNKSKLKEIFNFLMTNPIEDDYLLLYPRIKALRQGVDSIEIELELAEAIQ